LPFGDLTIINTVQDQNVLCDRSIVTTACSEFGCVTMDTRLCKYSVFQCRLPNKNKIQQWDAIDNTAALPFHNNPHTISLQRVPLSIDHQLKALQASPLKSPRTHILAFSWIYPSDFGFMLLGKKHESRDNNTALTNLAPADAQAR
jgi:hypothetical protein